MVQISIIEETAEDRNRLAEKVHALLLQDENCSYLLPQLNIKTYPSYNFISLDCSTGTEHEIVIVGASITDQTPEFIRKIKTQHARGSILALTQKPSFKNIECLSNYGADDVVSGELSNIDLYKRLFSQRNYPEQANKNTVILFDSGKGGSGVTSAACAFSELLAERKNKVLTVDLDWETQDLSRFLRAQPFLNDNLELLLNSSRPLFSDFIEQAITKFCEEDSWHIITPPVSALKESNLKFFEIFQFLIEECRKNYSHIIIDSGALSGELLARLYEVVDKIIFVINTDPAALHANLEKLKKNMLTGRVKGEIFLLENRSFPKGISPKIIKEELVKIYPFDSVKWLQNYISYNAAAGLWPGTGGTLFSCCNSKSIKKSFIKLIDEIGLDNFEAREENLSLNIKQIIQKTFSKLIWTDIKQLIPQPSFYTKTLPIKQIENLPVISGVKIIS